MFGFTGRILEIDLSARRATVLEPGPDPYRRILGGKGLAGN